MFPLNQTMVSGTGALVFTMVTNLIPQQVYSHLYPATAMATGVPAFLAANGAYRGFSNFPVMAASTPGMNGVNNNEDESFGFLLHVGHRTANGDLRWDANYFMNGGSNTGDTGVFAGHMGMSYFNIGADYRINEDWAISGEFVSGSVEVAPNAALVSNIMALVETLVILLMMSLPLIICNWFIT